MPFRVAELTFTRRVVRVHDACCVKQLTESFNNVTWEFVVATNHATLRDVNVVFLGSCFLSCGYF